MSQLLHAKHAITRSESIAKRPIQKMYNIQLRRTVYLFCGIICIVQRYFYKLIDKVLLTFVVAYFASTFIYQIVNGSYYSWLSYTTLNDRTFKRCVKAYRWKLCIFCRLFLWKSYRFPHKYNESRQTHRIWESGE